MITSCTQESVVLTESLREGRQRRVVDSFANFVLPTP